MLSDSLFDTAISLASEIHWYEKTYDYDKDILDESKNVVFRLLQLKTSLDVMGEIPDANDDHDSWEEIISYYEIDKDTEKKLQSLKKLNKKLNLE